MLKRLDFFSPTPATETSADWAALKCHFSGVRFIYPVSKWLNIQNNSLLCSLTLLRSHLILFHVSRDQLGYCGSYVHLKINRNLSWNATSKAINYFKGHEHEAYGKNCATYWIILWDSGGQVLRCSVVLVRQAAELPVPVLVKRKSSVNTIF